MSNEVAATKIAQMVAAINAVLGEPTIDMRPVDVFGLERIKRQWTQKISTVEANHVPNLGKMLKANKQQDK